MARDPSTPSAPHALLLSAGQGRRLLPLTEQRPKCALEFRGRSLLQWQIDTLLANGIASVSVVLGHGAPAIERLLAQRYRAEQVATVYNPFYRLTDNLASCWIARDTMHGDFLLINGDTVFDGAIVRGLLQAPPAPVTLCVDSKAAYDDDDMKVAINPEGWLEHVGKQLPAASVNGESIGITRFRPEGADLFRHAVEQAMRHPDGLGLWYLSVIDALAGEGQVRCFPVNGWPWAELDFVEDMQAVESVLASAASACSQGPLAG